MRLTLSALVLAFASSANAATFTLYDDAGAFAAAAGSPQVETFDSVASDLRFRDASVTVGDLTLSSIGANRAEVDANPSASNEFAPNGSPFVRVSLDAPRHEFTISWADPITAFAADFRSLNARGGARTDTVLTVLGYELDLPTVQSPGDTSFFGFVSDMAFTELTFTRGGRDARFGLDNVQYSVVPLPGAIWLLGGGILALGAMRSRRSKAV